MRQIITEDEDRVETGSLQINDDWPGIFIRGDNALYYSMTLQSFLEGETGPINRMGLEALMKLLGSCRVKKAA